MHMRIWRRVHGQAGKFCRFVSWANLDVVLPLRATVQPSPQTVVSSVPPSQERRTHVLVLPSFSPDVENVYHQSKKCHNVIHFVNGTPDISILGLLLNTIHKGKGVYFRPMGHPS